MKPAAAWFPISLAVVFLGLSLGRPWRWVVLAGWGAFIAGLLLG